jgi:predicted lipoprotein with Yx(FWY)xxD motif
MAARWKRQDQHVRPAGFRAASIAAHWTIIMKTIMTLGAGLVAAALVFAPAAYAAGMLKAKNDMTLYVFDKDKGGSSGRYDDCAKSWPPYMGKSGETVMKAWSVVKRKDDKKAGDKTGDGKGGVWHVVTD